jgi:dTDP-4-dehydrorhamnose reductase
MVKVLILGANGMLGHACNEILSQGTGLEVLRTSRANLEGHIQFDATKDEISDLISKTSPDWVINCIGIIKPHIKENQGESILNALKINSEFPFKLASATDATIIQIATDCVYSGARGKYREDDLHDALDVYGKTKSLGEAPLKNIIHLRASIIGPEMGRSTSLLEWFKNQPLNSEVNGFTDHLWNGVTTHHFAKIALGLITNNFKEISKAHVVPSGLISKSELLREFAEAYNRRDITINEVISSVKVDRTLETINPELNMKLWQMAGYQEIPSVPLMVREQAEFAQSI